MIKVYKPKRQSTKEIIKNGVMCPIPWIHFVTYPNGTAQICTHQSDVSVSTGNIFDNTFEEIFNHENIKNLRIDMIEGKYNSLCSNCHAFEKAKEGSSSRIHYLRKFDHLISNCLENTQDDGFLDPENFRFAYWNFKISGVCNLKCRTCHPHFSTSIYNEFKKFGWLNDSDILDVEKIRNNIPRVMTEILKHIEYVEEIHFVGGEPMLMNEHWQILEELIKYDRHDVRLAYHTNLSQLTFKKKHVFDYWKQIRGTIWLSPSIDAFSLRNSYIREGAVWEKINENLDQVIEFRGEMKNLSVVPTITASVLNVLYLDELVDYLYLKKVDRINFNIVRNPSYYHVSMLPEHLKSTVLLKLENCTERNKLDRNIFNIIKSELFNEDLPEEKKNLLFLFKHETNRLDEVRGIRFKTYFPELFEMLD